MKIKDEEHLNQIVASNTNVVVDFYADWCGPCKALAQVLDQYTGDTVIAKVDCDVNSDLAMKYGVRSIPHVVKFENGQAVDSFVGLNKQKLQEFLG